MSIPNPIPFPHIPNRAEIVVEELRAQHERIAIDLNRDDDKAPTWFAHVPGMDPFPVRFIGTWKSFVKFTGFYADDTTCDFVLVQPDNCTVSIVTLPKLDPQSKPFLGFMVPVDEGSGAA